MANHAPRFNIGYASADVTGGNPSGFAQSSQMVTLPDGSFLVGGFTDAGSGYQFVVTKFLANGNMDSTYGTNGINIIAELSSAQAFDMALDGSGNLVLAGLQSANGFPPTTMAAIRLTSAGSLDTTFADNGVLVTDPAAFDEEARSVLIQPDGSIILVGSGTGTGSDIVLTKFDPDGVIDTSFGTDGVVETDVTGVFQDDYVGDAALTPDGKIVVVGRTWNGTNWDTVIARFDSGGALDPTFNPTGDIPGIYLADLNGSGDGANSVQVLADGTIMIAGFANANSVYGGDSQLLVVKYNPDDTVDYLIQNLGYAEEGRAILVQPDGMILVAGHAYGGVGDSQFAIARFDGTTGSLDPTFGNGTGIVTTDFDLGQGGIAYDIDLDASGNIFVSGTRADKEFVIFKLSPNGVVDTDFGQVSTLDGHPIYTIGGPSVVLDPSVLVFDDELDTINDYGGSSITIGRVGSPNTDDIFEASGDLGPIADAQTLTLNGTPIGTAYLSGGQLTIYFDSGVTQPQVSEVLSSIAYRYGGVGIPPAHVQIGWSFNDGDAISSETVEGTTIVTISNPGVFTLDWSDRLNKLPGTDTDPLSYINFDATAAGGSGIISEVQVDTTFVSDSVANLLSLIGGSSGYSQDDSFNIIGTPSNFEGDYDLGGDSITTANGNDIVRPNGGIDTVATNGGNDTVELIMLDSTGQAQRQYFFNNTFDAGSGIDTLVVSGSYVDAGGSSAMSGDGPTRALLGFENLQFTTQSGASFNGVQFRLQDITDANGIHQVSGSSVADTFEMMPELGESYGPNVTIDISGLTFTNWNTNGQQDTIKVKGTNGIDTIIGNDAGFNMLLGDQGNDIIHGGNNGNWISGGAGDDDLYGGAGLDSLSGESGADDLYGTPNGGDYADYFDSSSGVSIDLTSNINTGGDAQGDKLYDIPNVQGSMNADTITGNALANILAGMSGTDILHGHAGNDTISGGNDGDSLYGEGNNDRLYGDAGNDKLYGGSGNDDLTGGTGDDRFDGGAGADNLYGSPGDADIAYYTYSTAGVTVNLATNVNTGGDAQGDHLYDIDRVYGSKHADTLTGNAHANRLYGSGGSDTLTGGAGADLLYGGTESDSFVFDLGHSGQSINQYDTIKDYETGAVGAGDEIHFISAALSIGGTDAAATSTQASIDQTTGIASFAAGSGTSLSDCLNDIARRLSAAGNTTGEMALFQVNGTGDYYVFISDGPGGNVTANDTVIRLSGVTSITSIDLTGGDLTILA